MSLPFVYGCYFIQRGLTVPQLLLLDVCMCMGGSGNELMTWGPARRRRTWRPDAWHHRPGVCIDDVTRSVRPPPRAARKRPEPDGTGRRRAPESAALLEEADDPVHSERRYKALRSSHSTPRHPSVLWICTSPTASISCASKPCRTVSAGFMLV